MSTDMRLLRGLFFIVVCQCVENTPVRSALLASLADRQLGACFDEHQSSANTCSRAIDLGVTQEECCRYGVVGRGWAPHVNVTASQMFYWSLRFNGVPDCRACHDTCEDVQCGEDRRCRMRNGAPKCVCAPDCSDHTGHQHGPVCATDGRTYRNYCALLKYNCKKRRTETVAYYGRCQYSCDNVTCEPGKHCVTDQNALPHCIHCQMHCNEPRGNSGVICGGDGVTYPSMCHLMRATCLRGRSIGVAYRARCQASASCSTVTCQPGQICLTDPSSQRPRCTTCSSWCSPYYGTPQLCGSDGATYNGWCNMHQTACSTGTFIETQHYGSCGAVPVSEIFNPHHEGSSED